MDKTPNQTYSSIQPFVQKEIQDAIANSDKSSSYKLESKPNIRHTGKDAPRINPKDLFGGFPVVTALPTVIPPQGTFVFLYTAAGPTLYLYVVLNGVWTNLSYHL